MYTSYVLNIYHLLFLVTKFTCDIYLIHMISIQYCYDKYTFVMISYNFYFFVMISKNLYKVYK